METTRRCVRGALVAVAGYLVAVSALAQHDEVDEAAHGETQVLAKASAGNGDQPPQESVRPGAGSKSVGPGPTLVEDFQAELKTLRMRKSQVGLGVPITVLGIGGAIAAFSGGILLGEEIRVARGLPPNDGVAIAGRVGIAGGLSVALAGGLFLAVRVRDRRGLNSSIERKEEQLRALGVEVSGIGYDPDRGLLVLRGCF